MTPFQFGDHELAPRLRAQVAQLSCQDLQAVGLHHGPHTAPIVPGTTVERARARSGAPYRGGQVKESEPWLAVHMDVHGIYSLISDIYDILQGISNICQPKRGSTT